LKRAWTRFWASVSLLSLIAATLSASPQKTAIRSAARADRDNEWKLAGLLPGHTALSRAEAVLGEASQDERDGRSLTWHTCSRDGLTAEADEKGIIQTIRVFRTLTMEGKPDCYKAVRGTAKWATGKGLRLGSPLSQVLQLYGKPDSRSPSTKGGQRLELLYYAFDWAGPDVPQVMEVVCTVGKEGEPGRVVEITLAASSL